MTQKDLQAQYAQNLLLQSGLESCVDDAIASQVAKGIPVSGRSAFLDEVQAALTPRFQVRLHIGGPGPGLARMAEINAEYTKRVQAWASVFAQLLGEA